MPYVRHCRFTMSGILGGAATPWEIFSYSFAVADLADPDDTQLPSDGIFDDLVGAITDYHSSSDTLISSRAVLQLVKCALILPNGHYEDPPKEALVDVPGGSTGGILPPQCSVRVSLRGPAAVHPVRGGWYLPMPTVNVDATNGLFEQARAESIANASLALVQAINDVWSSHAMVIASKVGTGDNPTVDQIRVGRVVDTIRSRRNAIGESYVTIGV